MSDQGQVSAPLPASPRDYPRPGVGGVVAAGAGSALLCAAFLVQPLLFLLAVVSPFPIALQRLRAGVFNGLLASLLAASLLAGVFSPGLAVGFLFLLALPGFLMGDAMARGRGLRRGGLWAFGAVSTVIGLALFFASPVLMSRALEPLDLARTPEFLAQLEKSQWTPEMIAQWTDQAKLTRDILAVVYPAAYVIFGGLLVLANAGLLRLYLSRRDPGWLDGSEFEGLRVPLAAAAAFVLAGASVVFPSVRPAGYNVLLVLAFLFALQGLAVVLFYARRLAAPPLLRAAVVLLVLVNPWAPQILALMGLFDIWLDLRKYAEPPAEAGQP